MSKQDSSPMPAIRIERLEASRVTRCAVRSASPEIEALNRMRTWAEANGLRVSDRSHRLFGFNDPCPTRPNEVYEYEVWLTVDDSVEPSEPVEVLPFSGGLYAVLRTRLDDIGRSWRELREWQKASKYAVGRHRALEEVLSSADTPEKDSVLDLFFPIVDAR